VINLYEETDEDEEHSIGSNPDDFLLTKEGENIKKTQLRILKKLRFPNLGNGYKKSRS
jgi:hypothetical protein